MALSVNLAESGAGIERRSAGSGQRFASGPIDGRSKLCLLTREVSGRITITIAGVADEDEYEAVVGAWTLLPEHMT